MIKLPVELLVNFLAPAHKGVWIVLCAIPVLGPILYLEIGRGELW